MPRLRSVLAALAVILTLRVSESAAFDVYVYEYSCFNVSFGFLLNQTDFALVGLDHVQVCMTSWPDTSSSVDCGAELTIKGISNLNRSHLFNAEIEAPDQVYNRTVGFGGVFGTQIQIGAGMFDYGGYVLGANYRQLEVKGLCGLGGDYVSPADSNSILTNTRPATIDTVGASLYYHVIHSTATPTNATYTTPSPTLQLAYLSTASPGLFPAPTTPPSTTVPATPSPPNHGKVVATNPPANHTGAIAGAVVGVVAAVLALAVFVFIFLRRRKARGQRFAGVGTKHGGEDPTNDGVGTESVEKDAERHDEEPTRGTSKQPKSSPQPQPFNPPPKHDTPARQATNPLFRNTDSYKMPDSSSMGAQNMPQDGPSLPKEADMTEAMAER